MSLNVKITFEWKQPKREVLKRFLTLLPRTSHLSIWFTGPQRDNFFAGVLDEDVVLVQELHLPHS